MADIEKISIVVDAEDNASSKLQNVRSNLSNLYRGINDINSALRHYNSAMSTFNHAMIDSVKEIGSAIYDFTSDSIQNFSDLSEQHAKTLGAMANDYDKTLESQQKFMENSEKLKQQAIDLAKYGINGQGSLASATQISATQTELVKAGISADTMLSTNVVKDILQFAQANQLETSQAVEFAVSLGSQFGVAPEDWGGMLDKISHTADMSVIDVADIVQSMKYAGGVTSGLDRDMSEVLGMISVLGNFGLKGSQAGSGIQALFTRLLTGDTTVISEAAAKVAPENALKAFYDFSNYAKSGGSEITYDDIINETFTESDITGELRPMDEVIDVMETVMSELTDEEQAWFAKKLFGLYQMKSAYALINGDDTGEMTLNEVIKEIETNSGGTNANKLAQLVDSQSGQIAVTQNLIDTIKTELGMMLEPTTLSVLHEVQEFLKDPGNYDINWDNIRKSLDESCDAIEEAYGTAIADAIRNLGGLTIDLGQVIEELAPEFMTGMLDIFNKAISGDFFGEDGVAGSWDEMIANMSASLKDLPPNLQELGEKTIDVIEFFGKLATLNIATSIAQLVTSALQIAMMTVNAASVIITGTGITGVGSASAGAGGSMTSGIGGSTVVGTADDIASITGTSVDDVIKYMGNKSKYTIDDIAKYMGASTDDVINALGPETVSILKAGKSLSKFGKAAGILGTLWQVGATGYEAYKDFESGDTKGGIEAIGGGAGSLAGAWAGAKGLGAAGATIGTMIAPGIGTTIGGAIGGVAGAIGGAIAGDKIGRWAGSGIYGSGMYDPTGDYSQLIPGFYALSEQGQQDAIKSYLESDITITPQFTMEAPQIQVDVTIDGNGNVLSTKQSILNPMFNTSINNWYQKIASQNGSAPK